MSLLNAETTEVFREQLAIVDSLIESYSDCHITGILGGDFNVDFMHNGVYTGLLRDFCDQAFIYPVIRHHNNTVDYTHHFNMRYFSCRDHFVVS